MLERWVGGTFFQFIHIFIIINCALIKLSDPAANTMKYLQKMYFVVKP